MAVGEFCSGLGASPTCLLFCFVFFTLCAISNSRLLPGLYSSFPSSQLHYYSIRGTRVLGVSLTPNPKTLNAVSNRASLELKGSQESFGLCSLSLQLPFCHGDYYFESHFTQFLGRWYEQVELPLFNARQNNSLIEIVAKSPPPPAISISNILGSYAICILCDHSLFP